MSSDTRSAPAATNRSKRRLIDPEDDARQHPAAEDSPANPKRQRVSRACDSCRSKKDKCDGVQPVCSTCASLSRPCTYKANPKKRGLPTGYIRTIELLWGLVFCKIQGSEEVVRALLKQANMPSHLATMGKEGEGSDTLLSSWKNSIVLRDIEKMLLFLEQPEDEQNRAENESPADAEGSSVLSADALEWHMPESTVDGREHLTTSGFSPVKTPSAASTARQHGPQRPMRDSAIQTAPIDAIPRSPPYSLRPPSGQTAETNFKLPSNTWPLLDIYFSYTQCWFPILEKHDILRTAFRLSEEDTMISPLSAGSGDYAALWAILTLASFQEASIAAIRQLPRSNGDHPSPNHLYTTTTKLIPTENGVYEVGHVQALLILSLVKIGQQDWPAAWRLVGRAIRIFQCLELDLSSNATSNGGGSAGRTKHVFLGCFVLETLVAVRTGHLPSLRKESLSQVGAINEDGLEEWHPWEDQTGLRAVEQGRGSFHRGPLHALSTFNRLVSLMCILNNFCCVTWSATTASQLGSLQRQLQLWVTALPKSYRVELQGNMSKPASPHIFGLEMMYEGASIVMSRELAVRNEGESGTAHKQGVTEGSKRLLMLVQRYMETYSLSATCPTFGAVLTLAIPGRESPDFEPGLKQKLQSFSSHLSTVWSTQENNVVNLSSEEPIPHTSVSLAPRPTLSTFDSPSSSLPSASTRDGTLRRTGTLDESRSGFSAPDSFLSNPWMRTAPSMDDNPGLSLPTPAPSININRTTDASRTPHRHRPSISSTKPMNAPPMMPDLTSPFPATAPQYQTPYNDPNLNLGSFVDVDGYGALHRPRIAPDLDALFDELASLDGTEKADNQPEFMQNLGFVPDAGIPELYSYASQMEPFLLAQTQPLPHEASGAQEGDGQSRR